MSCFPVTIKGDGNNWTANGYSSDVTANGYTNDTPIDNYATLNPLVPNTNANFTNGNRTFGQSATTGVNVGYSTIPIKSGMKVHVETVVASGAAANGFGLGIAKQINGTANSVATAFEQIIYDSGDGDVHEDGVEVDETYGASFTAGDRITMEVNTVDGEIEWFLIGS